MALWLKTTIISLLLGFPAFAAPPVHVACTATNFPIVFIHKNKDGTATEEEKEDWRVRCSITVDGKKIYDEALEIPHPTEYREAMDEIQEFRKTKAPAIVKENTKEKQ